mmetsp:Transcript_21656/g.20780  ORF Transcript_21656/g.20780 Transcript_21656/m.20780 type:complete len:224 (-) Transcript_21656:19-690(-)
MLGKVRVTTKDGSEYIADRVVVTVPLALLKNKDINFVPEIPAENQVGIDNLALGYMDKLILYFDHVFWPEDADWLYYINDLENGQWLATLNIYKYFGEPVLMLFNTAGDALFFTEYSDEEILENVMNVFSTMFGESVGELQGYARTNWSVDEFSKMSYSAMGAGGDISTDCDVIRKNINERVFFAGEHTVCELIGTADGAYISGHWAAEDILQAISGNSEIIQ